MIRLFSLSVFFLAVFSANACINTYFTQLDGTSYQNIGGGGDGTAKIFPKERNINYWRKRSKELLQSYQRTDSIEYYSDYGVALILLGEYQKAKMVFLSVEKRTPDLYRTASNLGTLYELTGKADSALYWIKKSVRIYPNSHEGSEWIHIRILEFKLQKQHNYNRSVLRLNFGHEAKPSNPQLYDLDKIGWHLRYQLQERINFIPAPDPIIANLYFDYGNVLAQTSSVESALDCYQEAERYGYKGELLSVRAAEMEAISDGNWDRTWKETIYPFIKEHLVALFISSIIGFFAICVACNRIVSTSQKTKGKSCEEIIVRLLYFPNRGIYFHRLVSLR